MLSPAPDVLLCAAPFPQEGSDSHGLLRRAAVQYAQLAPEDCTLSFGPYGKPCFSAAPQLHFNITHSGAYWMCAFSRQPVGLDLQQHQDSPREKLSRRFFHPREDAYLSQEGYLPFFDLWSAKESYVKFSGRGITGELEDFSVVDEDGSFPAVPGVHLQLLPWKEGYSLCLCTPQPCGVQFVYLT